MLLAVSIALTAALIASCEKAYEGPERVHAKEQADTTETTIRILIEKDWDGIIECQP